jgi:hypothetical protein
MISIKKIILLISLLSIKLIAYSQCAMCKAVIESDLAAGGSIAKGINNGILYLIVIPYLLLATVGFFVYKHYKKNKSSEEV